MRRRAPLPARAFSLVELLAAVAIVAVIAAFALPALQRARTQAKGLQCLNNLRQLGGTFLNYAADNEGVLPGSGGNTRYSVPLGYPAAGSSWSIELMAYLRIPYPAVNQRTLFLCPAAFDTYPGHSAVRTYMMNYQGYLWNDPTRASRHTLPAASVLLLDAASSAGPDCYSSFTLSSYRPQVDWRHRNGAHALYLDGHAGWVSKSDSALLEQQIANFGM